MSKLLKRLERYGVNITETMAHFAGYEALYLECMESFMTDSYFDKLGVAVLDKEYASAFAYAHTLKGVAGNLGFTPLFDAICGIVEPLRTHEYDDCEVLYENIMSEKKRLQQFMDEEQE